MGEASVVNGKVGADDAGSGHRQLVRRMSSADVTDSAWLNWLVKAHWPYAEQMLRKLMRDAVEPQLTKALTDIGIAAKALLPISFTKFELGMPPVLGPIVAYDRPEGDSVELDIKVRLSGDPQIELSAGHFKFGIKHLDFQGVVSLVSKPLMGDLPVVGGLQIFLMNPPDLHFDLTGVLNSFDFNHGMVRSTVHRVIREQIKEMLVLPRMVYIDFAQMVHPDLELDISMQYPLPQGVIRIWVKSCTDLRGSDFSLKKAIATRGKTMYTSDPYCRINVGARSASTSTRKGTTNPSWPETDTLDFFVFNPNQRVYIEVMDADASSHDDVLGYVDHLRVGEPVT